MLGLVGAAAACDNIDEGLQCRQLFERQDISSSFSEHVLNQYLAVQASGCPTRHGSADCSSYFLVTVTPATATIIKTTTHFGSSTKTAEVTSTSILDITATSVSDVAATFSFDVAATSTVDVTATSTVDVPGGKEIIKERRYLNVENQGVAPRQATVSPSSIPAYASACSGAARYSSACSCIGVTARTTTVASPSTTKTVTATRTTVVATVKTTDSTIIATVTDATSIITTTTGTITDIITTSTTTTTVTDSTTSTTTTVAPAASDCSPGESISAFILQVGESGTVLDGQYAVLSSDGDEDTVSFSSSEGDATTFTFNDVCNLESNSEIANVVPGSAASDLFFNLEDDIIDYPLEAAICSIVDGTLTCAAGANTIFIECEGVSLLHLATYVPEYCQEHTLNALAQQNNRSNSQKSNAFLYICQSAHP